MQQNDPNARTPTRNLPAPVQTRALWSNSLITIGSLVALFSFGCAAEMVIEVFGGNTHLSAQVGALILFMGVAIGGALFVRSQLKDRRVLKELSQEQRILSYAKSENGRGLTVSEISLTCSLSVTDTAAVLNTLMTRGVCQIDVSDDGELIYGFSCFGRLIEKSPDNS